MRHSFHLLAALLLLSVCSPLQATSLIPFLHLGEAATYNEAVVLAKAVGDFETMENGDTRFDTRFRVIEQVKGPLAVGTDFALRAWSRRTGGFDLDISGDFHPETGKTYLLFLHLKDDGVWQLSMLSYYVFEAQSLANEAFLVPIAAQKAGLEAMPRPDGLIPEPLGIYHRSLLLQALRAYGRSDAAAWQGDAARAEASVASMIAQDRVIPTGCDFMLGANLVRWANPAVPIHYDNTSVPAGWATTFSNILAAMNASYTGIDPTDAGSTGYTPTCAGGAEGGNFISYCDANLGGQQSALIIFEDPCSEITDLVACVGTLAIGGSYSSSGITHSFDSQTWRTGIYGYVIVNNGSTCLSATGYERMLTHELTHMYGMDHLDAILYPLQNMNPICCNAINTKDMECMNYAYPPPLPVELTPFDAQPLGKAAVRLSWETQSEKRNDYFSLERSVDGVHFYAVAQLASRHTISGGRYEWIDQQPLPGQSYYRLNQTDLDGKSNQLATRAVRMADIDPFLSLSPNPLHGDILTVGLNFPTAFTGTMEVLDAEGRVLRSQTLQTESGQSQVQQPLDGLPAGVYALRLYDAQSQFVSRFVKD